MKSIVDGLRPEFKDQITILYLDADTPKGKDMMAKYEIRSHPATIVTAADGSLLWKQGGGLNAEQIEAKLTEYSIALD